jgi:uncharacterized protein YaiI (UPF0178 family)
MKIWVDGDSCPAVIREILYKAAARTTSELIFVANRRINIPNKPYIQFLLVQSGLDVADDTIVEKMHADDLIITSDIPLAARVIDKGGLAISSRGDIYSADNIRQKLSTRNFMDELRSSGVETGGPSSLSKKDIQKFANALDQTLTRHNNKLVL